jgi:hypothetical protein
MKNKQENWIAMIMSGYSKKMNITISETAKILISTGCLNYLDEYYETLHLLSNEDVISELSDMVGNNAKK